MHSLQHTLHNARKTSLQQYHMPSKQTLIAGRIFKNTSASDGLPRRPLCQPEVFWPPTNVQKCA